MNSRLLSIIRKEFIQIFRDPRTLALILVMPIIQLFLLGYAATNAPTGLPDSQVLGANGIVSFLLREASADALGSLGLLLFVLLLRMLVRKDWVAIAVGTFVLTAPALAAPTFWGVLSLACMSLLTLLVLMRVGLVAAMVSLFVYRIFLVFPITFDTSAWYAGYGYAALLVVAGLALYGFRTSIGDHTLMEWDCPINFAVESAVEPTVASEPSRIIETWAFPSSSLRA